MFNRSSNLFPEVYELAKIRTPTYFVAICKYRTELQEYLITRLCMGLDKLQVKAVRYGTVKLRLQVE